MLHCVAAAGIESFHFAAELLDLKKLFATVSRSSPAASSVMTTSTLLAEGDVVILVHASDSERK